jgi:predicted CoA-binding protein
MPGNTPHRAVGIIGASPKPERYAYMAMRLLADYGHPLVLVSPRVDVIEGRPVYPRLADVPATLQPLDTLTVYVGATISNAMSGDILAANPRRVIFNPGAENPSLAATLATAGIEVVDGCTLVLLRTGQF